MILKGEKMKFSYGTAQLKDRAIGERQVYLLSNGLGGYSSTTCIQSLTRGDHSLFVAAIKAPDVRYRMISKLNEVLEIEGTQYSLSSQTYVDHTKNQEGQVYLVNYTQEYLPTWTYMIGGVTVLKTIVMVQNENTVGVKYEIDNPLELEVTLQVTPIYQFLERGEVLQPSQEFFIEEGKVMSRGISLYIDTKASEIKKHANPTYIDDYYFEYDARDGRTAYGAGISQVDYRYNLGRDSEVSIVFSMGGKVNCIDEMIREEVKRQDQLIEKSELKDELGKELVRASDHYIVKRESIDGLTLMAGYPFFLDWGRDTMYTVEGCCITTKRYEEAKNILSTFVTYLHKGIMPNLFPEGDNPPLYNTVDASLLFIQAVYLYYQKTGDIAYVEEVFPAIKEVIEYYKEGTDNDIKMDTDGLISAGSGLLQLTWMDVRYEEILPTPRHGKPVEISAYWYNALCVYVELSKKLGRPFTSYEELAKKVKKSFVEKFWNEEKQCLRDVVSGSSCDDQIRCNQIWAVSVPFSPLDDELALKVVNTVYKELYTPYGLRTLAVSDSEFVSEYSGTLKKRDLSYHQGTVWPFPLGSYFRAYLKVHKYSGEAIAVVKKQISYFKDCLQEGCIGQIAEIYDGLHPDFSRGCFAQGWSVGEILKVIADIEEVERN